VCTDQGPTERLGIAACLGENQTALEAGEGGSGERVGIGVGPQQATDWSTVAHPRPGAPLRISSWLAYGLSRAPSSIVNLDSRPVPLGGRPWVLGFSLPRPTHGPGRDAEGRQTWRSRHLGQARARQFRWSPPIIPFEYRNTAQGRRLTGRIVIHADK
jgi:hypothetical protein